MVSLFFSQYNGLFPPSTVLIVIFWIIFWVSSLPMSVTTHSNCCLHTNYFAERSYCRHIPPLGSLIMDLSSAMAMTPSMATDLAVTPHLYPLFLLLAAYPSKFVLDHYTMLTRWLRHSSWIIIRRCRADSARIWEHLAGFGKVSKVVSC